MTRRVTYATFALTVLFATGAASAQDDAANKKDLEAIDGAWKAESVIINGKEQDKKMTKSSTWTWTAKDKKYTFSVGKGSVEGTFVLDAGKTPKEMDLTMTTGSEKGKVMKFIYKLEDDTLTICVPAKVGMDRPTEFSSKSGSGQRLIVLKRQKS
jgi:uncharacterized protein (TIGR03067 family)